MLKKILLLGHTGKMGLALQEAFKKGYALVCKNSKDFDASRFAEVRVLINEHKPDIVINTVAFLGIEPCEKEPQKAFVLNTLYPKLLAELSAKKGFLLAHFSTDAVFSDKREGFCTEEDSACPVNIYGLTKFGGDCFIQAIAKKYYIIRISVLFGEAIKNSQFVEKMLERIKQGQKVLRISDDIILSPTYSRDVALQVRKILEGNFEFGLYHVANKGKASLCELMKEIVANLDLDVQVEPASHKDFPCVGLKNTCTPIRSIKLKSLRPWKEAVREYCQRLEGRRNL